MIFRQLIAGMPGSGKTTFIAALRHLIVAGAVPTSLRFVKMSDSEQHLNRLEEKWLACEEFPRTKAGSNTWVTLHLKDEIRNREASIAIPDLSGEAFRDVVTTGRCPRSLYDEFAASSGLLLFTNANRPVDDLEIAVVNRLAREMGEEPAQVEPIADGPPPEPVGIPFKAEDIPEEPKLVELLQTFNRRPMKAKRRLLAVIISAWDVVEPAGISPELWLSNNRPMLDQFISANTHLWQSRIYGISAQGGKLPADKKSLQRADTPSQRIQVAGPETTAHDLTAPLQWILANAAEAPR